MNFLLFDEGVTPGRRPLKMTVSPCRPDRPPPTHDFNGLAQTYNEFDTLDLHYEVLLTFKVFRATSIAVISDLKTQYNNKCCVCIVFSCWVSECEAGSSPLVLQVQTLVQEGPRAGASLHLDPEEVPGSAWRSLICGRTSSCSVTTFIC